MLMVNVRTMGVHASLYAADLQDSRYTANLAFVRAALAAKRVDPILGSPAAPVDLSCIAAAYQQMEAADFNKPLLLNEKFGANAERLCLELGRRQALWLKRAPDQRGSGVMQITIRNVELPQAMRGHGYLRALVAYLLARPGVEAVHLESVVNRRLAESCARDKAWVLQSNSEWRSGMNDDATFMHRPCFATFRPAATRRSLE